jgi:hypothetical protein
VRVRSPSVVVILDGQIATNNDKKLPCGELYLTHFSKFHLVLDTMSCFEVYANMAKYSQANEPRNVTMYLRDKWLLYKSSINIGDEIELNVLNSLSQPMVAHALVLLLNNQPVN